MFRVRFAAKVAVLAANASLFASGISHCDKKMPVFDPHACDHTACADKLKLFNMMTKDASSAKASKPAAAANTSTSTSTPAPTLQSECPLDRSELGHSTWNMLHTIAANYPDSPSADDQQQAINLIIALSKLYACPVCAHDFRENIALSPPRVTSRKEFSLWLCEQHNIINQKLNASLFACDMERLDLRWRKGGPGCWDVKMSLADERETEEEVIIGQVP